MNKYEVIADYDFINIYVFIILLIKNHNSFQLFFIYKLDYKKWVSLYIDMQILEIINNFIQ